MPSKEIRHTLKVSQHEVTEILREHFEEKGLVPKGSDPVFEFLTEISYGDDQDEMAEVDGLEVTWIEEVSIDEVAKPEPEVVEAEVEDADEATD